MTTYLSKQCTLERVAGLLRGLCDQLAPNKVEPLDLIDYIHIAVTKVTERLGLSAIGDYSQVTGALAPATVVAFSARVTGTPVYTDVGRLVTQATHGLSVGDTLIYWNTAANLAIGFVETVPTTGTFTVSKALGADAANSVFNYVKIIPGTADTLDISSFNIDQITKLSDATNGLCVPKPPQVLDDIDNNPGKRGKIHYYRRGETIVMKKGSGISAYGVLTLEYNRVPTKITVATDTLDIKDKYMSLVIDVAKLLVYEAVSAQPPEQLSASVEARISAFGQQNLQELKTLKGEQVSE